MSHIKSRKHSVLPHVTLTTALGAALAALPAQADEAKTSAGALPAVTVSGTRGSPIKAEKASSPKLTQPLVDTPQTVTVVRKEVLQTQAATTLVEALRNTPGITMQLGENGNTSAGDAIFMRGFSASSNFFVDNIRDLGAITRDVFNVEQVEIVKGPSGSDNGRGATGGYINLVTKLPQADNFAEGAVSYGSADRKRLVADVNQQIGTSGTSALRLNVMAEAGGVPGRDFIERKSLGFAPSLALGLGTDTRAYLYYQHVEQDNVPDGGVPTVGLPGYYLKGAPANLPKPDSSNYYGLDSDYEEVEADMVTLRLERDLRDGLTLRNTTRYGRTTMDRIMTGAGNANISASTAPSTWTADRSRQSVLREDQLITNQTNLTAGFKTGSVEHTLSTGVELIHEKQDSTGRGGLGATGTSPGSGTAGVANLYNPNRYDAFTTPMNVGPDGTYAHGKTLTGAVYLFDTLKFNEQWQFNGGVRLERFKTTFDGVESATARNYPTLAVGTLVPTSLEHSDTLFSWKAGVVYKPAKTGSIYFAYGTSARPPGSDNFSLSSLGNNANNPTLEPQEARNLELGTKWDLIRERLSVNAAVFRSINKNDVNHANPSDPTDVRQYGERRVQGLELAAVGNLTRAWQLIAGFAYLDAEVTEGSTLGTAGIGSRTGAALQWTPKISANLWTTYALSDRLTFGGGARYTDTVFRQIGGTPGADPQTVPELDSYWVFDAMASYAINRNLSLQLNVYNLTDEEYVATLNNAGNRYVPGSPRSALLTASIKF